MTANKVLKTRKLKRNELLIVVYGLQKTGKTSMAKLLINLLADAGLFAYVPPELLVDKERAVNKLQGKLIRVQTRAVRK